MEISSNASSTLTRSRSTVVIVAATAATLSYFVYRAIYDPLPEPTNPQRLHRSNAVRRRRRSAAEHLEAGLNHEEEADADEEEDGDSFTSAESQGDENVSQLVPLADGDTVADDPADWWDDPQIPAQRAGQNIVSLLFRVSEDNARRNAYVHRGCQCNACNATPIRGIRYRCANCADFDLCETCEAQGLHIKTHIFYKIKVPAPPFGPRLMQPVWYPGDPENTLRNLPRSLMARMTKETGFDRPELEAFWEQWTFIANTEWRDDPDELCLAMDRQTFERCLVPSGAYRHTAPSLIHDRMFAFYDTNNDDLIGFSEFLHGLSFRKRKDKLRKIFEGYDIDKDGFVTRRDFLRIFRAYYVLYKRMHRDILEGLDDQVMSSTEAHQLITGRQPLSSLFGREGRVPQADEDRSLPGKTIHSNGDERIHDGKDVVNEDKPDVLDRQDLLHKLMSKDDDALYVEDAFTPVSEPNTDSNPYWEGIMFPPARVDQLEPLLAGEPREEDMFDLDPSNMPLQEIPFYSEGTVAATDMDGMDDGEPMFVVENMNEERRVNFLPEFTSVPTRHRQNDAHSPIGRSERLRRRRSRTNTRKKLLERWKRRRFYLDEEEGALPPDGWKDEDDILLNLDGNADISKISETFISTRSRSSSKVRFAEDTDDFDIRSNPSVSSRSVPERWGGMDIPDAERDAGKEILYQVTQQAFNELLDILFQSKEELAIKCAETRKIRDKYRAEYQGMEDDEAQPVVVAERDWQEDFPDPREQSLEELLARSGYTVDESLTAADWWQAPGPEAVAENVAEVAPVEADEGSEDVQSLSSPSIHSQPATTQPELPVSWDPTMPQFRPNSSVLEAQAPVSTPTATSARGAPNGTSPSNHHDENTDPSKDTRQERHKENTDPATEPTPVTHAMLSEWRRLDKAEEEARERGGWGRLSFDEFERIYREEEQKANRLDYLGSWIDFCIP